MSSPCDDAHTIFKTLEISIAALNHYLLSEDTLQNGIYLSICCIFLHSQSPTYSAAHIPNADVRSPIVLGRYSGHLGSPSRKLRRARRSTPCLARVGLLTFSVWPTARSTSSCVRRKASPFLHCLACCLPSTCPNLTLLACLACPQPSVQQFGNYVDAHRVRSQ